MALLLSCNIMHSERWISKRRYLLHHQSSLELRAKWVPVLSNVRCNLTLPKHPSCKCLVRPRNNFQVGAYYAIALFMTKTEGWPEPIQHLGTGVATFRDLNWLWYLLYVILSVLQKDEGDTCNIMSYDSQMVDAQFIEMCWVVMQKIAMTKEYCHWLVVECYRCLCGMYFVQAGAASQIWLNGTVGAFQRAPSCCVDNRVLLREVYLHCFLPQEQWNRGWKDFKSTSQIIED